MRNNTYTGSPFETEIIDMPVIKLLDKYMDIRDKLDEKEKAIILSILNKMSDPLFITKEIKA